MHKVHFLIFVHFFTCARLNRAKSKEKAHKTDHKLKRQ